VNVAVASASRQAAVTVPQEAVQTVDEKPAVFMRTAEGFQLHPVVLGSRSEGYVEVLEGLAAGAQVASAGSFILKSELGKGSAEHSH
jgi:cobalt-zinc-cadmium efflux system membrane fusion protein